MRVSIGWTGEIDGAWHKAKVQLEEEDLRRLMSEHGMPDGFERILSTRICDELLQNEAEVLLLQRLARFGHESSAKRDLLTDKNRRIIAAVKAARGVA